MSIAPQSTAPAAGRSPRARRAAGNVLALALATAPSALHAQLVRRVEPILSAAPASLGDVCGARLADETGIVARIAATLALPDRRAIADTLRAMVPAARAAADAAPDDVEAAYRLAVILGALTDVSDGRDKVNLADEVHARVTAILSLDPDHAGAHHILGRLHAAVMRMGRLQRFLARNLIGGAALRSASWEAARRHLEAAESGDPCIPDHHFQLARLYADRDMPDAARVELEHVRALTENADLRWARVRSDAVLLEHELQQH